MTIPRLWPWKKEEQEQLLPDSDELLRASLPSADELLRISAPPTIPTAAPITARPPDSYVPPPTPPVAPSPYGYREAAVPDKPAVPSPTRDDFALGLQERISQGERFDARPFMGEEPLPPMQMDRPPTTQPFPMPEPPAEMRAVSVIPPSTAPAFTPRPEGQPYPPGAMAEEDIRRQMAEGRARDLERSAAELAAAEQGRDVGYEGTKHGLGIIPQVGIRALGRDIGARTIGGLAVKAMDVLGKPFGIEAHPYLRDIYETAQRQRELEEIGGAGGAPELTRGLTEFIGTLGVTPYAGTPSGIARYGPKVSAIMGETAFGSRVTGTFVRDLPGKPLSRIVRRAFEDAARFGYVETVAGVAQEDTPEEAAARQLGGFVSGLVIGGGFQTVGELWAAMYQKLGNYAAGQTMRAIWRREPPRTSAEAAQPIERLLPSGADLEPGRPVPARRGPQPPEPAPEPRIGGVAPKEPLPPVVSPTEQAGGIPLGPEPPIAVPPVLTPEEAYIQKLDTFSNEQLLQQATQQQERIRDMMAREFGEPGVRPPEQERRGDLETAQEIYEAMDALFLERGMGQLPEITPPEPRPGPAEIEVEPSPEGEPDKVLIGHIKAYLEKEQTPEIQKAIDGLLEGKTPQEADMLMRRARGEVGPGQTEYEQFLENKRKAAAERAEAVAQERPPGTFFRFDPADKSFVPVPKAKQVDLGEVGGKYTWFAYQRSPDETWGEKWRVAEATTGRSVGTGKTRKAAIEQAQKNLVTQASNLDEAVKRLGESELSPYQPAGELKLEPGELANAMAPPPPRFKPDEPAVGKISRKQLKQEFRGELFDEKGDLVGDLHQDTEGVYRRRKIQPEVPRGPIPILEESEPIPAEQIEEIGSYTAAGKEVRRFKLKPSKPPLTAEQDAAAEAEMDAAININETRMYTAEEIERGERGMAEAEQQFEREPPMPAEHVAGPVVKAPDGTIYEGAIHPEARDKAIAARVGGDAAFRKLGDEEIEAWYDRLEEEGYESAWVSNTGRFLSETEAQDLALRQGQTTQDRIDKNERLESLSVGEPGAVQEAVKQGLLPEASLRNVVMPPEEVPEAAKGTGRTPAIHDIDHEEVFTGRTFREALEQMDWNIEEALGEVQLDFEAGKIGDTLDWGWVDEAGNFEAGEGKMPAEFMTDVNDPRHGPPVPPGERIPPEDLKLFVPEEHNRPGLWVIRDKRPDKGGLATYRSPDDRSVRLAVFSSQADAEQWAGQWEWTNRIAKSMERPVPEGKAEVEALDLEPIVPKPPIEEKGPKPAEAVEPTKGDSWRIKADSVIGIVSRALQEPGKAKSYNTTEGEFYRDELVKALGENNEARAKEVMMSLRDAGFKIDAEAKEAPKPKAKKPKKAKKEPTPNARKLRYLREIRKAMPKPADRRERFLRGETVDELTVIEERFVDDYDRDLIDRSQYYRLRQEFEGRPVAEIPVEDEAGEVKKVLATNLDSEDLADHWVKVANRALETSLIAGDQWIRFDENIQDTRASHSESAGKAQQRVAQDKGVLTKVEGELFSRGWTFQDLIDRQSPGPEETALEAGVPADQAAAQADIFGGETLAGKEQPEMFGEDVGKRTAKLGEEQISAEEMAERAEPAEPEGEVPLDMDLPTAAESEARTKRMQDLQNRATKYEVIVERADGERKLVGYTIHRSGQGLMAVVRRHGEKLVEWLGLTDEATFDFEKGRQVANLGGGHVLRFSGETERDAIMRRSGELPHIAAPEKTPAAEPEPAQKTIRKIEDVVTGKPFAGKLYRGSGRADPDAAYNPLGAKVPVLGPGRYTTSEEEFAQRFGPNVEEVDVRIKKPLVIRDDSHWRTLTQEAGWTHVNPFGQDPKKTEAQIDDLRKLIEERGYDGVIVVPSGRGDDAKALWNVFGDVTAVEFEKAPAVEAKKPKQKRITKPKWYKLNMPESELAGLSDEELDKAAQYLSKTPPRTMTYEETQLRLADLQHVFNQKARNRGDLTMEEEARLPDDEIVGSPGTENFDEIVGSPPADLVSPEGRNEAADRQANIGYGLEGNLEKPSDWKKGDKITEPEVMHLLSDIVVAGGGAGTVRVGRMTLKGALGEFKVGPEVSRIRRANDITTAAHEVAHNLEKLLYGWEKGGAWKKPLASGKMQKELAALGKALYGNKKPSGGYKREGWAEFWRMWVKEEKGLEQRAPVLHKWFHEEFLPLYPDIATAANKARDGVRAWREQGAVERGRTKLVDPASVPERLQRAKEKVQLAFSMEKMIEMAQPLFELSKATNKKLAEQGKGPLSYSKDPYLIAAALRTVQAARTKYMIEDGMIDLAGNKVGPSLRDATNLVKGKQDDFGLYLYGKRSLAMWGDPQGFRDPGISRQDAEQIVEELGSEEFEVAAAKLYAWLDGVLDYMAEASPTFANVVANTRARDPGSYIPLARYFEEIDDMWAKSVGRTASQRSPVKHLKGSGRRIKEPFAQIIGQTEQMIRSAHARMVIDAIIKVSRVEGMGHIIEEVPLEKVPAAKASLLEVIKLANKELKGMGLPELDLEGDEIKLSDLNDEDLAQSITFFAPATWPKGVDPVVPIYAEGEVKWYRVDGKLYDTLSSLDVYRLPDVAGLPLLEWGLGKPAAAFRAGTTGLRASFGLITNPIRDFQTLYVNSRASANGAKLFWYWAHSMSSAMLNRASGGMAHPSEWLEAFTRLGGEMAQPLGQDIPHTRLAARKLFQGRTVKLVDPRNIFEFYRDLIQAPEMGARVAELRAVAKDIGWEPGMPMTLDQSLQMLLAGKQVSTDFTAAGELARMMNRMAPFFNAAIQGPRANLRAAKANKMKFAWRGAQLAMATIGLWWMYKDEDWYKELKPKEKFMYWHFPVDWPEPTLVRIPRAFEVGLVFSALPEAFLDSWYREDPEGVKEWMKVFMQTSIPNPAPVLPRVAAEQWKNEVFYFDRPIVPTREERKDPNEQYNEYTTKTAIKLAEIFSVGPVELSPMRIDHALTGVFGYTARDVLELLGLGGPELSREKEAADIPLFGRLFQRGGEVGTRPKSIQQVYDQLEDLQRIQYSSVKMETEEQRQRRLMLTDAANAISALFYVRRYTDRSDQRQALTREGLDIARDVLKTMKSDETVRGRFQTYRRQAEIRKEIMEAEQEGRPPDLGQGQRQRRPTRPRRPSR